MHSMLFQLSLTGTFPSEVSLICIVSKALIHIFNMKILFFIVARVGCSIIYSKLYYI